MLTALSVMHPETLQQLWLCAAALAELMQSGEAGGTEDAGRQWQPYTDHLAYAALAALPWGGSELAESAPAEVHSEKIYCPCLV